MTRRAVLLAVLAMVAGLTLGCATTQEDEVSSIPWNRPQQWEGTGALGGFRPPGSY
jgi:hypothetical protein